MTLSLGEIAEVYRQRSLDMLPYVVPLIRPPESVADYKDEYGVDMEGVSILLRGEAKPRVSDPDTLIGLSCDISYPKMLGDFKGVIESLIFGR